MSAAQPTSATASASGPPQAPAPAGWRRWWPLIAIALVGVVALVGAAWWALSTNPLSRLGRAADRTVEAETARTEITTTLLGVPLLPEVEAVVVTGDLHFTQRRASLIRTLPAVDRLPLVGRFLDDAVELRYDGADAWVALPISAERRWVRVTGAERARTEPGGAPGLSNPLIIVEVLRSVVTEPQEVGTEIIRGEETTRFSTVVDLERAAVGLPDRSQDTLRNLIRLRGSSELPVEVWLDGDDRVRRVRTEIETDVATLRLVMRTEVELFDFGADVAVEPPTRDQQLDLSEVDLPDLPSLPEVDPMEQLRELLDRLPSLPGRGG